MKKKIQGSQWPRNHNFVLLMHMVLGNNDDEDGPDSDQDGFRKIGTIVNVLFSRFIVVYFNFWPLDMA